MPVPYNKETRITGEGVKQDLTKNRLELLPMDTLWEVGLVLTFGAEKYAAHNWRTGMSWSRVIGAALRHLFAIAMGQERDPETGLRHAAHLQCCCMFLHAYMMHPEEYDQFDDRWTFNPDKVNQILHQTYNPPKKEESK